MLHLLFLVCVLLIQCHSFTVKSQSNPSKLKYFSFFSIHSTSPETSITDSESVHLKLTKTFDMPNLDPNEKVLVENILDLYEMYHPNDPDTTIAASLDCDVYLNKFLEYFIDNNDTTLLSEFIKRKSCKNLDIIEDKEYLTKLWKSSKLLSNSEKFPLDRRLVMISFPDNVQNSIRRVKVSRILCNSIIFISHFHSYYFKIFKI